MEIRFKYIALILLLSSCFKPDTSVPRIQPRQIDINSSLSENKTNYVSLVNQKSLSLDTITSWHLKFSMANDNWNIYLNELESVAVFETATTDFESIDSSYNIASIKWEIDIPVTNEVIPALGNWGDFNFEEPQSFKSVVILKLPNLPFSRFVKLQILDAQDNAYIIRYADLDNSNLNTLRVEKNNIYNFAYLAVEDTAVLRNIEPPKNKWALSFTYVTDSIAKDPEFPYLTTPNADFGIYPAIQINQNNTRVYLDSSLGLNAMTYFEAKSLPFVSAEELRNLFINYNSYTNKAIIQENRCLVLEHYQDLYALDVFSFSGKYPEDFSLKIRIKKL